MAIDALSQQPESERRSDHVWDGHRATAILVPTWSPKIGVSRLPMPNPVTDAMAPATIAATTTSTLNHSDDIGRFVYGIVTPLPHDDRLASSTSRLKQFDRVAGRVVQEDL